MSGQLDAFGNATDLPLWSATPRESSGESAPAAPTFTYDRPVTDDERALMTHVSRFGSDGYPVRKVGSRHWTWDYRSLSAPVLFPTKREATASFERYLDVIRSCLAAEAYRYRLGRERAEKAEPPPTYYTPTPPLCDCGAGVHDECICELPRPVDAYPDL